MTSNVFTLPKNRWQKISDDVKYSKLAQGMKRQMEENPVIVLLAVAAVITASAKLIDAVGHAKGSRAYARQVEHRIRRTSR